MTVIFRTTEGDLIELDFGTPVKISSNLLIANDEEYPIDSLTYRVLRALIRDQILLQSWCTYEHLARDDTIAVLLHHGYGDSWSYNDRECKEEGYHVMCDPDVARYVLRYSDALSKPDLIDLLLRRYVFKTPKNLPTVLDKLEVQWVDKYLHFEITQYDGYETVRPQ